MLSVNELQKYREAVMASNLHARQFRLQLDLLKKDSNCLTLSECTAAPFALSTLDIFEITTRLE